MSPDADITITRTERRPDRPRPPRRRQVGIVAAVVVAGLVLAGVLSWVLVRPAGMASADALADLRTLPEPVWTTDLIADGEDVELGQLVPLGDDRLLAVLSPTEYMNWSSEVLASGEVFVTNSSGSDAWDGSIPLQGGLALLDAHTGERLWRLDWQDLGIRYGEWASVSRTGPEELAVTQVAVRTGAMESTAHFISLETGSQLSRATWRNTLPLTPDMRQRPTRGPEELDMWADLTNGPWFEVSFADLRRVNPLVMYGATSVLDCEVSAYVADEPENPVWSAAYPSCDPLFMQGDLVLGLDGRFDDSSIHSARLAATGEESGWFPATGSSVQVLTAGDDVVVSSSTPEGDVTSTRIEPGGRVGWSQQLRAAPAAAGGGLLVVDPVPSTSGRTASRVDRSTGRILWTGSWPASYALADSYLANDDVIAVGQDDGASTRLLDAATGQSRATITGSVAQVGEHVVYGYSERGLTAWDADGGVLWEVGDRQLSLHNVPGRFIVSDGESGELIAYR